MLIVEASVLYDAHKKLIRLQLRERPLILDGPTLRRIIESEYWTVITGYPDRMGYHHPVEHRTQQTLWSGLSNAHSFSEFTPLRFSS